MATAEERNILKILDEESGQASEVLIYRKMTKHTKLELSMDYIRAILGSMGRRDLIDIFGRGRIRLAEKGWEALGKSPASAFGGMIPSGPPEPPEERYRRWITE